MSAKAIEVRGLSKSFTIYQRPFDRVREFVSLGRSELHETVWALRDVSFSVPAGTSCGLIGANGAGKSTTLKILAGKQQATEGEIEVEGRISSILELGTGFQDALTGRENAKISALFVGKNPWDLDESLERILDFAQLGDYADRPLGTYSSGMKARLAFSVLTCLDPEVLLLDEALATGDARFAKKCQAFLRKLTTSGCTTILVSHDLSFLVDTCQQLVWLDKGQVVQQGDPNEVAQAYVRHMGQATQLVERPQNLLFRLESLDPNPDAEYVSHLFEWYDAEGNQLEAHYLGQVEAFDELIEAATQLGFAPSRARLGWGESEIYTGANNSLLRRLRPHAGPGGVAYLAVPVPAFPRPVPVEARFTGANDMPQGLRVSVFYEGTFQELGTVGLDKGLVEGSHWYPIPLEVPAFAPSAAAEPAT